MWKYNIIDNTWVYLNGSKSANEKSNYTIPYLGGIKDHTMVADNTKGYLYIFGGLGIGQSTEGRFNDLWAYPIETIVPPSTYSTQHEIIPSSTSFELQTSIASTISTSEAKTFVIIDTDEISNTTFYDSIYTLQTNLRRCDIHRYKYKRHNKASNRDRQCAYIIYRYNINLYRYHFKR